MTDQATHIGSESALDLGAPLDAPLVPGADPRAVLRFRDRFRRNKAAMTALIVILLLTAIAIFAPMLAPHDPLMIDTRARLQLPSPDHWFGTDRLGRDVFSRLIVGTRASLGGAALTVIVATIFGVPLGVAAGYFRGRTDWVIGRLADVVMTFPPLIFALAVIAVFGPGLFNAMVTLGLIFVPRLFRVVRGATMAVRAETYVEASVSIGTPALTIMRKRIIPNVLPPLLVQLSIMMATALLAEAALSLLGLGVIPPAPSWGVELGQSFLDIHRAPEGIWAPGAFIAIATLAFNVLGDGLQDALGTESGARG